MSVNFDRSKSKWTTNNRYYKYLSLYDLDPYYDEYWGTYLKHPNGSWGSKRSNKTLYFYQVRMYRTWRHNRKTQYKFK